MAEYNKNTYIRYREDNTTLQKLDPPNWVITDLRFINEFDRVEKEGITIRINRHISLRYPEQWNLYKNKDDFDEKDFLSILKDKDFELYEVITHRGECELDDCFAFDYIIQNDVTKLQLFNVIKQILEKEKII